MQAAPFSIPSALLGQAVLFLLFMLVVWAVLREAAKVVVKIVLVAGLILAIAVLAGWLDESLVGQWLERTGDLVIQGLAAFVGWLHRAWQAVAGAASDASP